MPQIGNWLRWAYLNRWRDYRGVENGGLGQRKQQNFYIMSPSCQTIILFHASSDTNNSGPTYSLTLFFNSPLYLYTFQPINTLMRTYRSQTFKAGEEKSQSNLIKTRMPRQSEPNINYEEVDPFIGKNNREDKKERHIRQGRASEIVSPENYPEYFYSPKTKKCYGSPTVGFLSPPHTKPSNKLTKCTSSNNLFTHPDSAKFTKKYKEVLDHTKARTNLMQAHKQTLDKIEGILSSHGIQVNQKFQKNSKPMDEKPRKLLKSPRYSENLIPDYEIQFNRKQSESFGSEKKPNKQDYPQARQLKQTMSTNSTLKNPRQLKVSDFETGKEIGRGRFGIVKIARHKKTGLIFAMKIIKKSIIKKQEIIEQLIKQIKIQYFLNQANIVKLYSVFDDSENCYLLLQLCCEGNLYQRILKQHKFQQHQARGILKNICEGLAELHENKIIHRDLKPQNIVLNYGLAKICDFGWSTSNKDSLRETFCGTPLYVSPELLSGNSYDEKVDLWSIGILGYEMMTGKIPFEIKTERDLNKIIQSKIVYPKTMSPQAISFLDDLLSKDPTKRTNVMKLLNHPFLAKK